MIVDNNIIVIYKYLLRLYMLRAILIRIVIDWCVPYACTHMHTCTRTCTCVHTHTHTHTPTVTADLASVSQLHFQALLEVVETQQTVQDPTQSLPISGPRSLTNSQQHTQQQHRH